MNENPSIELLMDCAADTLYKILLLGNMEAYKQMISLLCATIEATAEQIGGIKGSELARFITHLIDEQELKEVFEGGDTCEASLSKY